MTKTKKENLVVGDRVEVIEHEGPFPIEVGVKGAVTDTIDRQRIVVTWDDGRTTMLVPEDPYKIIPGQELSRG